MKKELESIYVCLDSNQYIQCCYNFLGGKLKNLKMYCNQGLVKLIITDIIISEVKMHIKEDINEFVENRKRELNKARVLSSVKYIAAFDFIFQEIDIGKLNMTIEQQFEEYINDKNVIIIDNDMINLNKVLDDYFNIKPPFEKTKKRNEFKDAFIINILKNYSQKKRIQVHMISSDVGFNKAIENNHCFKIYKEISDFFNFMNDKCHKEIFDKLESYIKLPFISTKIEEETSDYLEGCTITLCDNDGCTYTSDMLEDIEFMKKTYNKTYFEEVDDSIIAHMKLNCFIEIRHKAMNPYWGKPLQNQFRCLERIAKYEINKDFEIEFGLHEEEGGLFIKQIYFNSNNLELDGRNLIESSLEMEYD